MKTQNKTKQIKVFGILFQDFFEKLEYFSQSFLRVIVAKKNANYYIRSGWYASIGGNFEYRSCITFQNYFA